MWLFARWAVFGVGVTLFFGFAAASVWSSVLTARLRRLVTGSPWGAPWAFAWWLNPPRTDEEAALRHRIGRCYGAMFGCWVLMWFAAAASWALPR